MLRTLPYPPLPLNRLSTYLSKRIKTCSFLWRCRTPMIFSAVFTFIPLHSRANPVGATSRRRMWPVAPHRLQYGGVGCGIYIYNEGLIRMYVYTPLCIPVWCCTLLLQDPTSLLPREIKRSNVSVLEKIGAGAFGDVYKVRPHHTLLLPTTPCSASTIPCCPYRALLDTLLTPCTSPHCIIWGHATHSPNRITCQCGSSIGT